jgi:hypothetical protein
VGAECGDIVSGLSELSLFCLHIPRTPKVMGDQVGERGRRLRRVGAWSSLVEFEMRRTTEVPDLKQLAMADIIKLAKKERELYQTGGAHALHQKVCVGGL